MPDSMLVDQQAPADSPDVKPAVSRGARACSVCRAAKMKCVGAEDDGAKPCQRCRRSNVECVFEKHRRGRKPGSKLSEASKMLRKLEKGVSAQKANPSSLDLPAPQTPFPVSDSRSAPLDAAFQSRYSPRDVYNAQRPLSASAFPGPPFPPLTAAYTPTRYPLRGSESPAPMDADQEDEEKDVEDTMYPAPMVEREGRRQSFFGTVLTRSDDAAKPPPRKTQSPAQTQQAQPPPVGSPQRQAPAQRDVAREIPPPRLPPAPAFKDPVSAGIITEAELVTLFEMIFVRLNPFINLFDPALHTPTYVRARCPLLFSILLMVGCKFWKPDRFRACQRIAEDLCVRAFRECWKRVEVVQAFMCMTYWKEPDDTRTWTYIGYASRMAVELGLNAYTPDPPPSESHLQRLERRNRERTYLVLWVHDRSLNMQTGRMWMLPEDVIIHQSNTWHLGSTLAPIDAVVAAQVQLRCIAAEVTDVFFLHKARALQTTGFASRGASYSSGPSMYGSAMGGHTPADVNYEILLRGCNRKLELWEAEWAEIVRRAGGERFHLSLLLFFKLHVRLFLNSFGLQSSFLLTAAGSAARPGPSLPALSMCYTSGVETLKLVGEEFAKVDMLRYGQDSITVMTAYCAVFLLKLLRSTIAGPEIGEGAKDYVYSLITAAADAYRDAAKNVASSLEFHGRFLRTLVVSDRVLRQRQVERHQDQHHQSQHDRRREQHRQPQRNGVHGHGATDVMSPPMRHTSTSTHSQMSPPSSSTTSSYSRSGPPNRSGNTMTGNTNAINASTNSHATSHASSTGSVSSSAGTGGPAMDTSSTTRSSAATSGLYQPRPTHANTPQTSYASYAWHFPASPHLPAHPLASIDGDFALDPQVSGYGNVGGVGTGGGTGAGGAETECTTSGGAAAAATQVDTFADGEGAANIKMELAYWYNMHSEMGYGLGVPPAYVNMPYRTADQA